MTTSAPRRSTELSTRKLLEAAADLIGDRGYEATSLVAIARAAGYSHGLITARFGSKEGLLQALLDRMVSDWKLERLASTTRPEAGLSAITGLLDAIRESARTRPAHLRALYALMFEAFRVPPLREPVLDMHQFLQETLESALEQAVTSGQLREDAEPAAAARLVVSALRGAAYQWLMNPDFPFDTVLDQLGRVTVMGLMPAAPPAGG